MTLDTASATVVGAPTSARRSKRKSSIRHRLGTVVLFVIVLLFMLPFLFTVAIAVRPALDVAAQPLAFPTHFRWANFSEAFTAMHYAHSVLNTVVIMVAACALVTVVGSMASYPLGRITAHWSTATYRLFILGTSVPIFVVIAPLYLLMRDLHLLGSRIGVVIIYTAINLPVAVFFFTSFVRAIPPELEEAAAVDGAGVFRTFFSIVFPLMRPVTGTLLTFISLQIWNDLAVPLIFLLDPSKRTVMVNAYSLYNPHLLQPTQLFPAALLGVVPLFVLFLVFQRQVVAGISAGAVKS